MLPSYLSNSSHFTDVEGTLPCTLQTALSPIVSQISPGQTLPFHFFKIYLNIIFPPKPKSFKWLFSSRFPTKGLHAFLFSPLRATCSFDHPNIWEAEIMKLLPVSCCYSLTRSSIFLSAHHSNTLSLRSSLTVTPSFTPI